jgi:multiple sugar transport system permease protein
MSGRGMHRESAPVGFIKKVILLFWASVAVFPIYWVFCVVFAPKGASISDQFYPKSVMEGFSKIIEVLTQLPLLQSALNSCIYAAIQVVGTLVVVTMAAYEFALFKFRGNNFLFMLALSSLMVPRMVTLIPLYRVIVNLRWLNTFQGLAVPGMAAALSLFICRQFMETLPKDLIDAAGIDGCSHFGVYWRVILPLCGNAVTTISVLAVINVWGEYLWPLVTLTKKAIYPISLIAAAQSGQQSWQPIYFAMTTYFLSAIPPIIVYVFLQRFVLQGVATSGMKS